MFSSAALYQDIGSSIYFLFDTNTFTFVVQSCWLYLAVLNIEYLEHPPPIFMELYHWLWPLEIW